MGKPNIYSFMGRSERISKSNKKYVKRIRSGLCCDDISDDTSLDKGCSSNEILKSSSKKFLLEKELSINEDVLDAVITVFSGIITEAGVRPDMEDISFSLSYESYELVMKLVTLLNIVKKK